MKVFKRIFIVIILLLLYLFFSIFSYASTVSNNLENNIFRLHILANSDSNEDQSLKLKVRDNIISYLEKKCDNCKSKSDFIYVASSNLENLKTIAENTISEYGFNYTVEIEIDNFYFPTKYYGKISLPAGYYDGLKVKIGNAQGQVKILTSWAQSKYPNKDLKWLKLCDEEQLNSVMQLLKKNLNYNEFYDCIKREIILL